MDATLDPTRAGRAALATRRLDEVRQCLASMLDLPVVGNELLGIMVETSGATRASLMLSNPHTGRLRILAGVGLPVEVIGQDLKPALRRISDWVFRERRPLILNGEVRDQRFEGSAPRNGIDSALSVPLVGGHGPFGVLNLARVSPAAVFEAEDMAQIEELARPLVAILEDLQELEWAERSWRLVRTRTHIPRTLETGSHSTRCYQVALARTPSPLIGGDVCERTLHANGAQTLMLADVAGRGAAALTAGALLQGLFLGHARYTRSPAEMARLVNRELCERFAAECPAALWLAYVSSNGQITSCNGGFPEPLCIPKDGADPRWLSAGGPLAGVSADAAYEQETIQLLPGDAVLAVSDGVLGASDAAGHEFGLQRVEDLARELRHQPLARLVGEICDVALAFTGAPTPVDDLTVLGVRFSREE